MNLELSDFGTYHENPCLNIRIIVSLQAKRSSLMVFYQASFCH
ncbi:hypothetical protein EJK55_0931 [Moraxella catarrhalis]|uniref:Uncharacterized protein n=1 Tax=Moraxella catarrhalis TaxID=480 RepID=A0A3Q9GEI3_MORCA|nr:hypothetical protein MCR_0272 [Moraxella catarrhalis BBH18]AZQ86510.1 hypothetical protein EJK52_0294 [Moraxella catarrhalis]EKF84535.1 hypothetical protein MCRH_0320 [Moraxella catarrhalis RH4]AZQ90128.1 hypothetical protein EJK50_0287 [Moraxella catarrhalis]AZQ91335.1 hypothetical protein EJK51_0293 [Moraxella catarrhalis]